MSVNDKREISEAINALGEGDYSSGRDLLFAIADRLNHARAKHPWPEHAYGAPQAVGALASELREVEFALEHELPERIEDEALDVVVVGLRIFRKEHYTEQM